MKVFKREKGQSMVEFAIILPILLLLLGPIVDLGRVVYAKTQLQNVSSDLLHMVILENEYSYQGGSFQAIEDKVISENYKEKITQWQDEARHAEYWGYEELKKEKLEQINKFKKDKMDGNYLIKDIFDKFIETEGLDKNYINTENYDEYVKIGPVKKGFAHTGHYPKLEKNTDNLREHGGDFDEYGYDNKGYDKHGLDRIGYDRSDLDIFGNQAGSIGAERRKHERWELKGVHTEENATYYREVYVTLPYEVENITFTGKMLFGDTTRIEETASGIIYMGGDGRDITDPIYTGGDASNE